MRLKMPTLNQGICETKTVKLVEFLACPEVQQGITNSNFAYPANPRASVRLILAKWGAFKQDDIDVAAASEL